MTTVMLSGPPPSFARSISPAMMSSSGSSLRSASLDLLVADDAGQAVRAQQDLVAGLQVEAHRVDVDLAGHADRAGDDRPLGVGGRFLLGDLALVDEVLHQGVVVGQLVERARRGAGRRASRRRGRGATGGPRSSRR
jgi:hypothetical protein